MKHSKEGASFSWLENRGDETGNTGQAISQMNQGPGPQAAYILPVKPERQKII